jgi:hypothetical protein
MKSSWIAGLLALLVTAPAAMAHFVWVSVEKDSSGQPAAHVWFSELAEPDSADLLDKITTIKVAGRAAAAKPAAIAVTKQVQGNGGALVGSVPAGTQALSAQIRYGVVTRGENTFLLQYYAKYLDGSAANLKAVARDESLALDVVPHVGDGGYTLEVLYQGKPVADAELVIFDPTAAQTDLKTDSAGRAKLAAVKPGLYSIRAKWVVKESGKERDQAYTQVNHYSTLALRVSGK